MDGGWEEEKERADMNESTMWGLERGSSEE